MFTERIETLKRLRERLAKDLRLRDNQVEMLHGGLSDVDQQRVVEDFGNAASPLRLLICSDVGVGGHQLHFQCHRLIHFDMPWSLMVFQQRNGRVDRYRQERTPHAFGRHEAPVLAGTPGLAAAETVFVLSGLVPNRRSHPLLYEWVAVAYRGARFEAVFAFDEVIARTGLARDGVANRGLPGGHRCSAAPA